MTTDAIRRVSEFLCLLEGPVHRPIPPPSISAVEFLEKYGRKWEPAPLPENIQRGEENRCYQNAADLALYKGLTYVEGAGHAWCVDAHGRVVDNTWPADLPMPDKYWGVPFDTGAVVGIHARCLGTTERRGKCGMVGVLAHIELGHPWLIQELHRILAVHPVTQQAEVKPSRRRSLAKALGVPVTELLE